jgi:hypothetical protein
MNTQHLFPGAATKAIGRHLLGPRKHICGPEWAEKTVKTTKLVSSVSMFSTES